MHLFFSQSNRNITTKVLQELNDYCNCENVFGNKTDDDKIRKEIDGLIDNLQVMKSVKDECTTFANYTR